MSTKDKKPDIRFKGFSKIWFVKKLEDLTETGFSNGVFNDPQKVGKGYRLINVKDMYSGNNIDVDSLSLVDIDEKEFKNNKVEYGDIFFTRSSLVKEGIAYSNVNLSNHQSLTYDGHLIRMQPCKKLTTPIFLASLFKTSSARNQFILGGKTTTMTTIGQSDIASVKVAIPSTEEQTKIGNYFQQLDTLIIQHQHKHDKLLNIKKALLEKMFPKQGEDVPEIRFKGISGAWKGKVLREVGCFNSGFGFPETEQNGKFGIPYYKVSDMNIDGNQQIMVYAHNFVNEEQITRLKYKPISEESIIFAKVGAAIFLERKRIANNFLIDNNMMAFSPSEDVYFIKLWFESIKLSKYAQVGALPSYNSSDLKVIELCVPQKAEQIKIRNTFKKLDQLITQHQTQLKKLKNIKQACLEKMFV